MNDLVVVVLVGCFLLLYALPALVASSRGHQQTMAITVLTLLLGWSLLGWIIALVWACTAIRPTPAPTGALTHTP
jgi:hypothetical protein